jgi:hypothetical protein
MTPLRQQMIAALQLSGKAERTQQAYVREVHLLAQFYHKSPDRLLNRNFNTTSCTGKTSMASPPRLCGSAIAASASSINTSSNVTGTRSR